MDKHVKIWSLLMLVWLFLFILSFFIESKIMSVIALILVSVAFGVIITRDLDVDKGEKCLESSKLNRGENPPHLYVRVPEVVEERWGLEEDDSVVFLEDEGEIKLKVV